MKFKIEDGSIVDGNEWVKVKEKITYPEVTGLDPEGNIVTNEAYQHEEYITVQLNFASVEDLARWKVTTVEESTRTLVDGKFYFDNGEDDPTPRNLVEVKEVIIKELKSTAAKLLDATDWIIVRATELNEDVDVNILNKRSSIRECSNVFESQVNACMNIEELQTWYHKDRIWN